MTRIGPATNPELALRSPEIERYTLFSSCGTVISIEAKHAGRSKGVRNESLSAENARCVTLLENSLV